MIDHGTVNGVPKGDLHIQYFFSQLNFQESRLHTGNKNGCRESRFQFHGRICFKLGRSRRLLHFSLVSHAGKVVPPRQLQQSHVHACPIPRRS